jgi:hypothetical protein
VNPGLAITLTAPLVPQILLLLGIALGIFLFIRGFPARKRSRSLATNGISKTGKAMPGPVRVAGTASAAESFATPVTGGPCFAFRVTVWIERQTDDTRGWELALEEERCSTFWLDDGSGKLRVEAKGADLDLPQTFQREFGHGILPADQDNPVQLRAFLERLNLRGPERIRVRECSLKPGARVFVAGTVAFAPTAMPISVPERGTPLRAGQQKRAEVINLSLGQNEPRTAASLSQQGKIAAALQRARVESPAEWAELDKGLQKHDVSRDKTPSSSTPDGGRNGGSATPPEAILRKSAGTLLISYRAPETVASIHEMEASLMMYGGPALTLICLYLLAILWGWA